MPAALFRLLFPFYLLLCSHVLLAAVLALTKIACFTYLLASFSSLEVILQDNHPNWLRTSHNFSLFPSSKPPKGERKGAK